MSLTLPVRPRSTKSPPSHHGVVLGRAPRPSPILYAAVLAGWLLCSGCGDDLHSGPTGSVTGKVSYRGTPLTGGFISLYCPETGHTAASAIQTDGQYSIMYANGPLIGVGRYQVSVTPPLPPIHEPGEPVIVEKTSGPRIPKKYLEFLTTDLTIDVVEGPQTINIELKD